MLDSGDGTAVCEAILSVALHDPDAAWVTDRALRLVDCPDFGVRAALARIHRAIDEERVVPALRRLSNESEIAGRVEDALDDIAVFVRRSAWERAASPKPMVRGQ
ncbi:hypothetical protein ABZ511_11245 [Nocardia gamkensis]|uniref:hypothetical protein n=1 Tax=Nocardia gamkensis TaxID=352869 RepID=UPI0033CEED2C